MKMQQLLAHLPDRDRRAYQMHQKCHCMDYIMPLREVLSNLQNNTFQVVLKEYGDWVISFSIFKKPEAAGEWIQGRHTAGNWRCVLNRYIFVYPVENTYMHYFIAALHNV